MKMTAATSPAARATSHICRSDRRMIVHVMSSLASAAWSDYTTEGFTRQRFVPDSPLEGTRFEPSVPGPQHFLSDEWVETILSDRSLFTPKLTPPAQADLQLDIR